jgi:hypothetical protein
MATVDLGKISFTQKGTWNSGTAYVSKDVVQYTDDNETSSYVAVASSTNQAPSTNGTVNTSYWALFAKGATVGSTNEGVWDIATAYQKNAVVQYTDSGTVSTFLAVADSTGETPSTGGTVNSSYWQLIAKGTDSAGLSWQSTIVTGTTLTALAGNGYWIDTSSNACTVTLPASASVGDTIEFVDYARTWGTNSITINQNSLNFQGQTSPNPEYNTFGQSVRIVYSGATQGWIPTSDDDVTYETAVFYNAEYLLIAGGASGGVGIGGNREGAGGGGAGGYRNSYASETSGRNSSTETPANLQQGTTYTITVGGGGATKSSASVGNGNDGDDSSISGSGLVTITSIGGGGGGEDDVNGNVGGSGGGAGPQASPGGSGTANQGFDGGDGVTPSAGGGGGGGASANGAASPPYGGAGGNGLSSSITGSAVTRAGGGGGSGHAGNGAGGSGGGGAGGQNQSPALNAIAGSTNTGGGGGGGVLNISAGAAGGSGVVILRVATSNYSGTTTGSPTVSVSGSDTILTYTGSGSYTA